MKRKAWKLLSEWVRRSAADEHGTVSCYTCRRTMRWQDAQAGHFVPGRAGAVLLNASVIRVQCALCNVWLRGNYHAFTLRMLDEVGREEVNRMLSLKRETVKWNRTELESFIGLYFAKLEELKSSAAASGGDGGSIVVSTSQLYDGSAGPAPY